MNHIEINPTWSVSQAADHLEQHLRQMFGQATYERLSLSIESWLGELTRTADTQFFGMIVFIGQAQDTFQQALGIIWLARKRFSRDNDLIQELLDHLRQKPVGWLVKNAEGAVRAARRANQP